MPRPNHGPYIHPGPKGVYEIRYTEAGRSRRYSTGTTDRHEAQKALGAFLLADKEAVKAADKPTVRDILTRYYDQHLAKLSSARQSAGYRDRLLAALGDIAVEDLTADHIELYTEMRMTSGKQHSVGGNAIGRMRKKIVKPGGASSGTVRTELATLAAAFGWHVRRKLLDPKLRPYIPLPAENAPRQRWLSPEEVDTALATAMRRRTNPAKPSRVELFLHIALGTGSRPTAIYKLQRRHVNLESRTIDYRPYYQTKRKRGALVPISARLFPIIATACAGLEPDDLVLGQGAPLNKALRDLAKAAKVPHFTPHTMRHTYASQALQSGEVTLEHVAAVLGDTVATVEKVYGHHDATRLRHAVDFTPRRKAG